MEYIALKQYRTYFIYQRGMSGRVSRLLDRQIKEFTERLHRLPKYIRVLVANEIDMSNPN